MKRNISNLSYGICAVALLGAATALGMSNDNTAMDATVPAQVASGHETSEKTFITFDYTCCKEERVFVNGSARLKALFSKTSHSTGRPEIGIYRTDLNDDGKIDFISYVRSSLTCGSSGCEIGVYLKTSGSDYLKVEGPSNVYPRISVSQRTSNGMRDLIFAGREDNQDCLWQWDGKKYTFFKCY